MTRLEQLHVDLRRALESDDLAMAECIATELSPLVERLCDELDRDPGAITPAWGLND